MKQRFSTRTRLVSALLTLAMVFTFLPISAFAEEELTDNYGIIPLAEYVIPDEAFRKYLKKFDTNNDDILAPAERYAVKEIDVSGKYISNLYGIQFFPNLKKLVCYNKQLTSLDVSQNTALEYLDCANNQLTSLDVSQNPALQTLDCSKNQLTSLDVRQNTKLDVVWCYQNQLTELDVRQNAALEYLYCQENQLTELDVRKNIALQNLACYSNALTSLDVSKNTQLKKLYCYSNQLTSLDVSRNPALLLLSCGINQLTELDVRQNPALKYLYCSDNQLTELDLSRNNKIFELEANNNYLTSLNVENTSIDIDNSGLVFAALGNTYPITVGSDRTFDLSTLPGTFDVTKATRWNGGTVRGNTLTVKAGATKVTYLYDCGKRSSYTFTLNVIPEDSIVINASNFPDPVFREYLKTETRPNTSTKIDQDQNGILSEDERNAVTKIDVSKKNISDLSGIQFFPNLRELACYNNQLTELDVSKNTKLMDLSCGTNQLTSLDVSQNPALDRLLCGENNLTSLDVSQNPALKTLSCSKNNLTSLDVRQNAKLGILNCSENNLTSLDVRQNHKLGTLRVEKNHLTSLDVSQNAALDYLSCQNNQLTSLDVSQNPALWILVCNGNQLTSLDVSKNTKLSELECYQNQLTSLDLSQTAVTELKASDNKITIKVEETSRTFNLSTLPGTFDVTKATNWSGGTVSGKTLTVNEGVTQVTYTYNCGKDCNATFTLNVKVVPDGTVIPPTPGGDTPGGTTPGGGGGGAVVIVAAAGAVAAGVVGYGVYNYVSGRKLQALLPEGVAAPENRAQTALLLWNTAGRPEPAEAPTFADVADPDTAKAAQWCVEQGLMKRRLNGKFAPGSSIPAYQVLNAYRKLVG